MLSVQALHTLRLPACAKKVIALSSIEQVEAQLAAPESPFIFLGEGSNTGFVADFAGTVYVNALKGVTYSESDTHFLVSAQGGEDWHSLVKACVQKGIDGFENLALIPGTVGAAPVQNIGAYGVEIAAFIDAVHGYDLTQKRWRTLTNAECQFGYRDSIFKHELAGRFFITQVDFKIPKAWQAITHYGPLAELTSPTAKSIFDAVIAIRQSKLPDPYQTPNAGSFFKNPVVTDAAAKRIKAAFPECVMFPVTGGVKLAAGWLIDHAGLKGFSQQGVLVNPKQALVLINQGSATGQDLVAMVEHIQGVIWRKFAVRLEHEVRLIGADGEVHIEAPNE